MNKLNKFGDSISVATTQTSPKVYLYVIGCRQLILCHNNPIDESPGAAENSSTSDWNVNLMSRGETRHTSNSVNLIVVIYYFICFLIVSRHKLCKR